MKKFLLTLGLVFLSLGGLLAWFAPRAWRDVPPADAPSIEVRIAEGWSATQIAYVLAQEGVIDSAAGYRLYANADKVALRGKPGTYRIAKGTSYKAIARILATGPARDEVEVRVIEGWDLHDMREELRKDGIDPVAFERSVGAHAGKTPMDPMWRESYIFLADLPKDATLEGYLYPDTYRVYKDQLPEGLIKKQLDAFAKRAPRLMEEAAKQGRTLHQVVTLASIVEKEVAKAEDRKIVAGIFWNRLKIGMPLQSDATVNYVTREGRSRPTYDDIDVDSPYNTYKVKGLPPGPVSNPGEGALEAALFPAQTDYHFFLTDPAGKTYFAKTFEEHIANRNKAFRE
jgi:UPF0755 protein